GMKLPVSAVGAIINQQCFRYIHLEEALAQHSRQCSEESSGEGSGGRLLFRDAPKIFGRILQKNTRSVFGGISEKQGQIIAACFDNVIKQRAVTDGVKCRQCGDILLCPSPHLHLRLKIVLCEQNKSFSMLCEYRFQLESWTYPVTKCNYGGTISALEYSLHTLYLPCNQM
ncbi:hypothetical protein P3386_24505, partial [Vibrio parahaemolyticus]|nr:hypothetical protein [Vibrio parahaemolyticus]